MMVTPVRSEFHVEITSSDTNAVDALAEVSGLSKQRIKMAMQRGAAWLTTRGSCRRIRRAKKVLRAGDALDLYYDETVLLSAPVAPTLMVDEGDYSLWFKPCGLLSQGSKWGDHCTVSRWAEQHLTPQRPSFIIHRLDRAATGFILVGHTKKAAAALSNLFQAREIEKRYRVIVHGEFPEAASPATINIEIDGKAATSQVTRIKFDAQQQRSLLSVHIETGRKHQIRRHLSESGYAVVGDRLYGAGSDKEDLQLTACYLAFKCPLSGKPRRYTLADEFLPIL
ncbi:MAG: RNA pseudouridine synthase [Thiotrichaceae bacterium]|nr:RNA pseudouridine synthase [Thiotrichaceae bacterium]PCI12177.1 MAG: RNA pseudouridine synthase [Thiotrichales bacterium]